MSREHPNDVLSWPADIPPVTDVIACDLDRMVATLTNGRDVPITNLFNGYGQEVADWDDAVVFVCGSDADKWFCCHTENYAPGEKH